MELVKIVKDQPVTSSLQVAEVFGKQHKDVLESIRDLIEDITRAEISAVGTNADKSMFIQSEYQAKNNFKKYPMYYMTKDAWTMLVMGYTGKKAIQFKLQYIEQFNKMEEELKQQQAHSLPKNYAEALRRLADQIEKSDRLAQELDSLRQPKIIEQTELVLESPNRLYTTSELAEELGYTSAYYLNQELHRQRIAFPLKGKKKWKLYAPYQNKGLTAISNTKHQKWTEKGREFVITRCSKEV